MHGTMLEFQGRKDKELNFSSIYNPFRKKESKSKDMPIKKNVWIAPIMFYVPFIQIIMSLRCIKCLTFQLLDRGRCSNIFLSIFYYFLSLLFFLLIIVILVFLFNVCSPSFLFLCLKTCYRNAKVYRGYHS